jgi:hypothetical protein
MMTFVLIWFLSLFHYNLREKHPNACQCNQISTFVLFWLYKYPQKWYWQMLTNVYKCLHLNLDSKFRILESSPTVFASKWNVLR